MLSSFTLESENNWKQAPFTLHQQEVIFISEHSLTFVEFHFCEGIFIFGMSILIPLWSPAFVSLYTCINYFSVSLSGYGFST